MIHDITFRVCLEESIVRRRTSKKIHASDSSLLLSRFQYIGYHQGPRNSKDLSMKKALPYHIHLRCIRPAFLFSNGFVASNLFLKKYQVNIFF